MTQQSANIIEFDPVIYPTKLWVLFSIDDLKEFTDYDGDDFKINEKSDTVDIFMLSHVKKKISDTYGIAIVVLDELNINAISHEAVHAASAMFDYLGISMGFDYGKDEHYAYLVGWAAECIEMANLENKKTKTK